MTFGGIANLFRANVALIGFAAGSSSMLPRTEVMDNYCTSSRNYHKRTSNLC